MAVERFPSSRGEIKKRRVQTSDGIEANLNHPKQNTVKKLTYLNHDEKAGEKPGKKIDPDQEGKIES